SDGKNAGGRARYGGAERERDHGPRRDEQQSNRLSCSRPRTAEGTRRNRPGKCTTCELSTTDIIPQEQGYVVRTKYSVRCSKFRSDGRTDAPVLQRFRDAQPVSVRARLLSLRIAVPRRTRWTRLRLGGHGSSSR